MNPRPRSAELCVLGCHACGLVSEAPVDGHDDARCPRCGTRLQRRRPASIERAFAFLLAGIIFYIPANMMPVMHTVMLNRGSDNTILQGVVAFWKHGSYGIALVIFIASVAVPCAKFLILGLLLITARRGSGWARRERARLHRLVELVGYWSMLDVLVVAIVAALVKFQALAVVEPRPGIFFFGGMVILTMLSAMQFDPRLTWDGKD
ncbi:paraquat-inducible protein A [Paraburkholderia caffeinilytica]|uniref:Paraquat-inducible protein A n=1 Tax=Paraburkholderia caffeinilytica TaxID=1761016 RepID=A0ABQ1NGB6_9BURK|nr:paraquat-inducible protein A [Paraburkholderia caffeinilytica]GGC73010.1 paraquat-inducible protein A [Paraburkholderia caffeinilytica]CAB3808851.1 Intermembrane transport protein PqiA [Paraburkholderia caffeinilytica]